MAAKVAGELYEGITGQLFEIGRQLRQPNGYPFDPEGLKSFLQLAVEGKFNGATAPAVKPAFLKLIGTTTLGEVVGKKTRNCFTGKLWSYRDTNLDNWLPAEQAGQSEGIVSVYQLGEAVTSREMAAKAVGLGAGTSLDLLAKALREGGHTFTLPAIEQMVDKQEAGENVDLRTDGYANFAFVEDANGSVSVVVFVRSGGRLFVNLNRLDCDRRWDAGNRLLLRNSVASTL